MFAVLSFVLIAGACSKKEEPKQESKQQVSSTGSVPPVATMNVPEPAPKKAPPVVTPGHLPPNPRMPPGSMFTSKASDKQRMLTSPPQQAQPAPAAEPSGKNTASAASARAVVVQTPEDSNQARQKAVEEMFRLRSQQGAVPPSQVNTGAKPEDKSAPSKNQQ